MADIGSLALKLTADPSGFEKGLAKAERDAANCGRALTSFGQAATNMGNNVVAVFDAISANPWGFAIMAALKALQAFLDITVGTASALKSMTQEGQQAALAQGALERKFGLSADAAGGFALQVKQLGLDQADVNHALIAYQAHLGDAAAGNEAAAKGFARLGLDAATLMKLPLEQQLGKIGAALKGIENPAERTSAAYAALSRRAAALVPIVQQGTAAQAAAIEQSKLWGTTFAQGETAAAKSAAIAANTAATAVESIRQSFGDRLAALWNPVQEGFSNLVVKIIDKAQPVLNFLRQGLMKLEPVMTSVLAGFERAWDNLAPAFEQLGNYFMWIVKSLGFGESSIDSWADKLGTVAEIVGTVLLGAASAALAVFETIAGVIAWIAKAFTWLSPHFLLLRGIIAILPGSKPGKHENIKQDKKGIGDFGIFDGQAPKGEPSAAKEPRLDLRGPSADVYGSAKAFDAIAASIRIGQGIEDAATDKTVAAIMAGSEKIVEAVGKKAGLDASDLAAARAARMDHQESAVVPAITPDIKVKPTQGPKSEDSSREMAQMMREEAYDRRQSRLDIRAMRDFMANGQTRTVSIP